LVRSKRPRPKGSASAFPPNGIISTVAGPKDYLIIDADSHASIYDACKMCAGTVIRFKHNDAADLDKRLQRLAGTDGNKIIVVEGIYSMLGDQAPLAEMAAVKLKHGCYLSRMVPQSIGELGVQGVPALRPVDGRHPDAIGGLPPDHVLSFRR